MTDDPYVYRGTSVLKNKFGIRDADKLDFHEREIVAQRIRQIVPSGSFDLPHLCAIHRHLFQDVYDWAGKVRTIDIAKGGNQFQAMRFVAAGMADIHRRLTEKHFLSSLAPEDFAREAGTILGDLNYVHPFREGNGRTQLQYLKQLAERAGHRIDLTKFDPEQWHEASRSAHWANYDAMARAIAAALQQK